MVDNHCAFLHQMTFLFGWFYKDGLVNGQFCLDDSGLCQAGLRRSREIPDQYLGKKANF